MVVYGKLYVYEHFYIMLIRCSTTLETEERIMFPHCRPRMNPSILNYPQISQL